MLSSLNFGMILQICLWVLICFLRLLFFLMFLKQQIKIKHQTDWKTDRLRHPPWISLQACQAYTGDSRAQLQGKRTTREKRLGMGNQEQKQRGPKDVHTPVHVLMNSLTCPYSMEGTNSLSKPSKGVVWSEDEWEGKVSGSLKLVGFLYLSPDSQDVTLAASHRYSPPQCPAGS